MWHVISIFRLTAGQDPIFVNDVVAMCEGWVGLGVLLHLTTVGDRDWLKPTLHWSLIVGVVIAKRLSPSF